MANPKACDLIEEVFNKVIKDHKEHEEGDILVEWVLIGYVVNPNDDSRSAYPIYFSNGSIATHHARGLLSTALINLEMNLDE